MSSPKDSKRESFFRLGPEAILRGAESIEIRATGRVLALNSLENRVYEVEIDCDPDSVPDRAGRFRVVKYYRPGRWSAEQIMEEHSILRLLHKGDIPVVPPLQLHSNQHADCPTLGVDPDTGLFFSVFPKIGGRLVDELSIDRIQVLGRLVGRLHRILRTHPLSTRPVLRLHDEEKELILQFPSIPTDWRTALKEQLDWWQETAAQVLQQHPAQTVHGDLHVGNVIWRDDQPTLVDFDDVTTAPCVQDVWMLFPGAEIGEEQEQESFLSSYSVMNEFDSSTLRASRVLRVLRIIKYTAWIAKRWDDPVFPRYFPRFNSEDYWSEQLSALRDAQRAQQEPTVIR